jgi:hypothetical protein
MMIWPLFVSRRCILEKRRSRRRRVTDESERASILSRRPYRLGVVGEFGCECTCSSLLIVLDGAVAGDAVPVVVSTLATSFRQWRQDSGARWFQRRDGGVVC